MAFIIDKENGQQKVQLDETLFREAKDLGISAESLINEKYKCADMTYGSPYQQLLASEGMGGGSDHKFGLRPKTLMEIVNPSPISAAANVDKKTDPFGSQSRFLFPLAVITAIEDSVQPDRVTEDVQFRQMSAMNMPIAGDTFAQPVLDYGNAGGANTGSTRAKAGRITQLAQAPTMLFLTTSDTYKTLPTYGIGVEMSDKAMKSTTLDLFTLTLNRFLQIEKDERVYTYLSNLFAGDLDHNTGAVSAVTSSTLNGSATAGVMTHKAWVKFLARNRKKRHIDYVICDHDTYLKIESRTGRPGSNNYDPSLARIDPQVTPIADLPFGANVRWMIVDPATEGGPVPANTVWALDSTQAFMMVENTEAAYSATEQFVLRRSEHMVWHWSEEAMRLFPTDLTMFDVLTID
jgi:hypothetical protein